MTKAELNILLAGMGLSLNWLYEQVFSADKDKPTEEKNIAYKAGLHNERLYKKKSISLEDMANCKFENKDLAKLFKKKVLSYENLFNSAVERNFKEVLKQKKANPKLKELKLEIYKTDEMLWQSNELFNDIKFPTSFYNAIIFNLRAKCSDIVKIKPYY